RRSSTGTRRGRAVVGVVAGLVTMWTLCAPAWATGPAGSHEALCARGNAAAAQASTRACATIQHERDLISVGSGLAGAPPGIPTSIGQPGGPAASLGQGLGGIASTATTQLALTALETWVSGGATFVL